MNENLKSSNDQSNISKNSNSEFKRNKRFSKGIGESYHIEKFHLSPRKVQNIIDTPGIETIKVIPILDVNLK